MLGVPGHRFEPSCVHIAPIRHSGHLHAVGGMPPWQQFSLSGAHASQEREQFRACVCHASRELEGRREVGVNPKHTEIGKSGYDEPQYGRL